MMNRMKSILKNKRGDIFQFIIIIAIVAIIAVVTLPKLNEQIGGTAENAIEKIGTMETEIEAD